MDEAFDARLELDKCAVVRDRHNLAVHTRADRVLGRHVLPRVALELLEAERDALALPIDIQDLDLELHADLDHLARMRDAAPRHVRDVQQAVHATEIDECTEVRDVLDDALPHLILRELLHELLALAGAFLLEDHATRHHNVAATLVELDDLELVLVSEQFVDVRHATERDLRTREERIDAHEVDDHAALDLLDERAFDRHVAFVGDADALPHAHEVGLLLGQDDGAFLVLEVLEEHFNFIADLKVGHILEFFERDRPFGLEADIQDNQVLANFKDVRLDDLTFFDRGERAIVQLQHPLVLVGRELVFFVEFRATVGEGAKLALLQVALFARRELIVRRLRVEFVHVRVEGGVQLGSELRAQFSAHTCGSLRIAELHSPRRDEGGTD